MRIKFKEIPKVGTRRLITKFLWIPKIINHEMRWFESTTWVEEVQYTGQIIPRTKIWHQYAKWVPLRWCTPEWKSSWYSVEKQKDGKII